MRTISLRLDAESDGMLRALCDRLHTTQTDVVRQALELLANSESPTPDALGRELGLVGAFASGTRGNGAGHSAAVKARLADRQQERRPMAAHEDTGNAIRGKRTQRASKP